MTAAETLQRQASRLTTRQTYRVTRDGGAVVRVTMPPLLELLASRLANSETGRGGSTSSKSKPPIVVAAFDLRREIDSIVTATCREMKLPIRYLQRPAREVLADAVVAVKFPGSGWAPDPKSSRFADGLLAALTAAGYAVTRSPGVVLDTDVIGNLRQLIPALIAEAEDPNDGALVWWTEKAAEWATRIEAAVGDRADGSGVIPLPMPCPDCAAQKVTRVEDGETYRDPALVAVVRGHEVQDVTCGACGAKWHRGASLGSLASALDSFGSLLAPYDAARVDELGYDLALGYAPPMFSRPAPELLDAEAVSA